MDRLDETALVAVKVIIDPFRGSPALSRFPVPMDTVHRQMAGFSRRRVRVRFSFSK